MAVALPVDEQDMLGVNFYAAYRKAVNYLQPFYGGTSSSVSSASSQRCPRSGERGKPLPRHDVSTSTPPTGPSVGGIALRKRCSQNGSFLSTIMA